MRSISCQLIIDPPRPGVWNMAFDEALLERAANDGTASLRLYQWAEPTLSLGYFQRYAERETHVASREAAVVRRQSGGGAILHDRELTYSIAIPPAHSLARRNELLYSTVHREAVATLESLHASRRGPKQERTWRFALSEGESPHEGAREPFLCFERRATGDVVLHAQNGGPRPAGEASRREWKIVGSAQRRHRGAILQHGSLLLRRSPAAPELAGVADLLEISLEFADLAAILPERLAGALHFEFANEKAQNDLHRMAHEIAARKYGSAAWTNRR